MVGRGRIDAEDRHFKISSEACGLRVSSGEFSHLHRSPFQPGSRVGKALEYFLAHVSEETSGSDRERLNACASGLGKWFAKILHLDGDLGAAEGPRRLYIIESSDARVLSLPWELLQIQDQYVVKTGRVDVVRTSPVCCVKGFERPLRKASTPMSLLVNVSSPEISGKYPLNYEEESWRISQALHTQVGLSFTDLGTVSEFCGAIGDSKPTGIHFSGHGRPGHLEFEDDEGYSDSVSVHNLMEAISGDCTLAPQFCFLGGCHGNTLDTAHGTDTTTAFHLHQQGITHVVAYYGTVADCLCIAAEADVYAGISRGMFTFEAVAAARRRLLLGSEGQSPLVRDNLRKYPFAWAQLVVFSRGGRGWPLSKRVELGDSTELNQLAPPERTYVTDKDGNEVCLATGFLGRRRERHLVRRLHRTSLPPVHVFVFHGLGGLGKTALAYHSALMLQRDTRGHKDTLPLLPIWCKEMSPRRLVHDITSSVHCYIQRHGTTKQRRCLERQIKERGKVGRSEWETVDFEMALETIIEKRKGPQLVVYLDNMESLMHPAGRRIGQWRSHECEYVWKYLSSSARQARLVLVASTRYRNPDILDRECIPVGPLGTHTVLRLMQWFPHLRQLSYDCRRRLAEKQLLHCHRGADLLESLISRDAVPGRTEYDSLYGHLQSVTRSIRSDLSLQELWGCLSDDCQQFLYRATLVLRPMDREFMALLGRDGDEDGDVLLRLVNYSLVQEQRDWEVDSGPKHLIGAKRLYVVLPVVGAFVSTLVGRLRRRQSPGWNAEADVTLFCRLGTELQGRFYTSSDPLERIDAAEYLLLGAEFERAVILLCSAAQACLDEWRPHDASLLLDKANNHLQDLSASTRASLLRVKGVALQMEEKHGDAEEVLDAAVQNSPDYFSQTRLEGHRANAMAKNGKLEVAICLLWLECEAAKECQDFIQVASTLHDFGSRCLQASKQCSDHRENPADTRWEEWFVMAFTSQWEAFLMSRDLPFFTDTHGKAASSLGRLYAEQHMWGCALRYMQKALRVYEGAIPLEKKGMADCCGNLGGMFASQGKELIEHGNHEDGASCISKAKIWYKKCFILMEEVQNPRSLAFYKRVSQELLGSVPQ
ncbi:hypothetical protein KIPB_002929 [Kipferlia bialata]|uniref:CHAT domain-containing protein n=1 Tax=Kipferlia bialata TaxID=797122 RepID=A0A391NJR8_9EUKA|nr:hypothetical protein KIPB_002929 [Kipferlia bialata]|eukprot:g2929.t1